MHLPNRTTNDRIRRVRITAGNLRQNHLYVNGHLDFFPRDCIGGAKRQASAGTITLHLQGFDEAVETDIGRDAKSGKPRGFFRRRGWVGKFFRQHGAKSGDWVAFERLSDRAYRVSLEPDAAKPSASPLRCAEFFAGIGLVRLALERQGWQVVYANDIDPKKAEMYRHNWPSDDGLHLGDIHQIDAATIPDCELFTASFPCNDLSIAGKWEGLKGKESSAFWGLIRILDALGNRRPRLVLLENVVGFLMSHKGKDFETALLALNRLGYSTDAVILNASRWTPQSRARLFVVAKQLDVLEGRSFALASDARPKQLIDFIHRYPNVRWDLAELPHLPNAEPRLDDILEDLPDGDGHWWSEDRVEYFMQQFSDKHAAEAEAMIQGRAVRYATAFRRVRYGRSMAELRTDGIAGCLRTPRGGSGRQILFKAGRGKRQVRLLTARECARLQGVPDSYVIDVPLNQALFGFGDAVCVPAVEWVLKHCLAPHAVDPPQESPVESTWESHGH